VLICASRTRSKTTEFNEWESVDNPRESGHPKPTSSDEDTASQSERLFEKYKLSPENFRGNPWFGPKLVSESSGEPKNLKKAKKFF